MNITDPQQCKSSMKHNPEDITYYKEKENAMYFICFNLNRAQLASIANTENNITCYIIRQHYSPNFIMKPQNTQKQKNCKSLIHRSLRTSK